MNDDDLSLVKRVLSADADAMAALETRIVTESRKVARATSLPPDELAQLLREKLLVGKPPKLAQYDGSGPFDAWLRTVAIRSAGNARRPAEREIAASTVPDTALIEPNPELRLLRLQYRAHFKESFTHALSELSAEERTVLRLHSIDGLSLGTLGTMFHKDASNISRWLSKIRGTLLERTRAQLGERLSLEGSELESVMRVADSELTMSLSGLLEK